MNESNHTRKKLYPINQCEDLEMLSAMGAETYFCVECDGTGEIQNTDEFGDWYPEYGVEPCFNCNGSGEFVLTE